MSLSQNQLNPILGALGSIYTLFSNNPNVALTGTLSETVMFKQKIPANLIGNSGILVIIPLFTNNNSVNAKTMRIKFGGTSFGEYSNTANLSFQAFKFITNSSINSQISSALAAAGFGTSAGNHVIGAIDTTKDQLIEITGQLADVGDKLTLEATYVGVIPWNH